MPIWLNQELVGENVISKSNFIWLCLVYMRKYYVSSYLLLLVHMHKCFCSSRYELNLHSQRACKSRDAFISEVKAGQWIISTKLNLNNQSPLGSWRVAYLSHTILTRAIIPSWHVKSWKISAAITKSKWFSSHPVPNTPSINTWLSNH